MTARFAAWACPRPLPRPGLLLALLLLCSLGLAAQALAASDKATYGSARKHFQALSENRKKASQRTQWEQVEQEFTALYKANPKGPYAAKALMYVGRVHEGLAGVSGLKSDLARAEESYGRSMTEFPGQRDMDELLLRRARIRARLDLPEQAKIDYRTLIKAHPRSSQAAAARKELKTLEAESPEPPPAPKAKERTRGKAKPEAQASPAQRPEPQAPPVLEAVNYASGKDYTRVTLVLDREARHQERSSSKDAGKGGRFSVTLPGVSQSAKVPMKIQVNDPHLERIRTFRLEPDTVKVQFDLKARQEVRVSTLANPFRLVLDVHAPGVTPPRVEPEEKEPEPAPAKGKKGARYVPPEGSRKMASDLVEQLGLTVRRVMIDPGHGGNDPGAQANGHTEKELNLKFARILGALLEKKGLIVNYTRTADKYISLEERTTLANNGKADMFLSIHCNANKNPSINGIETYSLNLASSRHAVSVAARENAQEPRNISDLQVILTDLMLSSKLKESRDAAANIQAKAVHTVEPSFALQDHGVREAPFYVLMGAKMPSVLIEIGYLTNKAEARRLHSDKYLNLLAKGIATGVMAYKTHIEQFAHR
jgi:N-acetylmuramoyl-L-alanine amidase